MKAREVRRLKEVELENLRLKQAVAELTLDKLILKEANDLLRGLRPPRRGGGSW